MSAYDLIERLESRRALDKAEYLALIDALDDQSELYLFHRAKTAAEAVYGKKIYIRGLIEISNYCKNNCYYCGIRRGNRNVERYRLSEDEILNCCKQGYALGFRTFVLQGGEDGFFTDEAMCGIIRRIKAAYPDCAVTLSLGERSHESYKALRSAGADR